MKTSIEARPTKAITVLLMGLVSFAAATAGELRVPQDHATIQMAINAALNNDTIQIASGVYTGQVKIISKKLSLIGQPGTILRATPDMQPSLATPARVVPIMEIAVSDVTLRGLTFEGERLAEFFPSPSLGDLEAILSRGSSLAIERSAFYGFRESAPGADAGTAIVFANITNTVGEVSLRVTGCTFADNDSGILVFGSPTRRSVNVTIENNTIIGLGPRAAAQASAGITIREGVGGRIAGNTISGFSYTGTEADFDISFGIEASHQGNYPEFGILEHLEIEGNILRDNQVHLSLMKANGSTVKNNRFLRSAPGIVPLGFALSGTDVTIANNQFENMPEGIRLFGNEPLPDSLPGLGETLGIAVNVQVTSNRFCNVTLPITRQLPATAVETGTLTNDCSSPLLVITPAALVSWRGEDMGWTVETAPGVDGPWTPSDATPFEQHGRHNIALPTDAARRFIRLR